MAHPRIITPDPAFHPDKPIYLNGFLFVPVEYAAMAAENNACDNGCAGAIRALGEKA